mgnify:CR=1 FL=1
MNTELQEVLAEIDSTLRWIKETRQELNVAESQLTRLEQRRRQIELTAPVVLGQHMRPAETVGGISIE